MTKKGSFDKAPDSTPLLDSEDRSLYPYYLEAMRQARELALKSGLVLKGYNARDPEACQRTSEECRRVLDRLEEAQRSFRALRQLMKERAIRTGCGKDREDT